MDRTKNISANETRETPAARTSMFWRLWWRALSVKRSQAFLAISSLMVGAAISALLLTLYSGVKRKMTEDFRSYGANVVVSPASAQASAGPGQNNLAEESALTPAVEFTRAIPGASALSVLYGVIRVSPESADPRLPEFTNAIAAGADLNDIERMNPGWRVAREGSASDPRLPTCAVGSSLAASLHLKPGDAVNLSRVAGDTQSTPAKYAVAAVITTGSSEDDQIVVPLESLQALLGLPGKVSLMELSIPGETREVEAAIRRLSPLVPGLDVRPVRQIVYSEGKVLGTIRWLLVSLTALILVIIALCVTATMTAIVLERRKDIGVMKALGAADSLLVRLFMTEGAGLGLAAGILGYAVGALLAREVALRLFGVGLSFNPVTLVAVCGLTIALAIFAGQVPVRIVKGIQPTSVLKGE